MSEGLSNSAEIGETDECKQSKGKIFLQGKKMVVTIVPRSSSSMEWMKKAWQEIQFLMWCRLQSYGKLKNMKNCICHNRKTNFNIIFHLNLKQQKWQTSEKYSSRPSNKPTQFTHSTCSCLTSDQSIFYANSDHASSSSETAQVNCPDPRPSDRPRQTSLPGEMLGWQMTDWCWKS